MKIYGQHDYFDNACKDESGAIWRREEKKESFHWDLYMNRLVYRKKEPAAIEIPPIALGQEIWNFIEQCSLPKKKIGRYPRLFRDSGTFYYDLIVLVAGEAYQLYTDNVFQSLDKWEIQRIEADRTFLVKLHMLWKAPIISLYQRINTHDLEVTLNRNLKAMKMIRLLHPVKCYELIDRMLSNELAPPAKPLPVPSDETMRDIKGFDRWSFRREPQR